MLYFSHRTRYIGEVDRGDTVTDYLPEERDRGITIIGAVASLNWNGCTLHLLDTPGHVDFTMEVERCLTVMDSAVVILDGTKGVQAQTQTVWHQADRYYLPRLVFVNKMDRDTASLTRSVHSLASRLKSNFRYVPIHWPIFAHDLVGPPSKSLKGAGQDVNRPRFIGLVDLVTLKLKNWSHCTSPDDQHTTHCILYDHAKPGTKEPLSASSKKAVMEARSQLLANIAEVDEEFADHFLKLDHPESCLPNELIQQAVRRATHSSRIVPVLVGSSRHNIGVQSLLDAVVDYLPDPTERPVPPVVGQILQSQRLRNLAPTSTARSESSTTDNYDIYSTLPIMLVFKICFDPHRGALSLVRIYSGSVKPGSLLYNWTRTKGNIAGEKVLAVLQLTGDQRESVSSAGRGSIVALSGLQSTSSGDVLGPPLRSAGKVRSGNTKQEEDFNDLAVGDLDDLLMSVSTECKPVVYAAIEPASLSVVRPMEKALNCLQREDPSFTARLDPETGQWTIGGMGDLHLEVIMSRLRREYKVDARMGPLLIAYKECPGVITNMEHGKRVLVGYGRACASINGRDRALLVELRVESTDERTVQVHFSRPWHGFSESGVDEPSTGGSHHRLIQFVRQACLSALEVGGPLLHSPVVGVLVNVHNVLVGQSHQIPANLEEISSWLEDDRSLSLAKLPHLVTSQPSFMALLRTATSAAIGNALEKQSEWHLMEPMMHVELRVSENEGGRGDTLSQFLGDLSARRAEILSVDEVALESGVHSHQLGGNYHVIQAIAPLAELVGYSAAVRTISSGQAELHLQLSDYRPVSAQHQERLLNRLRWSSAA
ncbi:unnamed protein product [Calicophoron daubneyi]|uniref:Tr-type G domain-containing protein n=1 Tax=Calicophoron daubneyi TaxID=300641 RepID=A0AAV2T3Y7_CALDB